MLCRVVEELLNLEPFVEVLFGDFRRCVFMFEVVEYGRSTHSVVHCETIIMVVDPLMTWPGFEWWFRNVAEFFQFLYFGDRFGSC